MINVRTARRVLDNLEDRRGRSNGDTRKRYLTREDARKIGLKRARAQKQATRGLIQLHLPEYDIFYREALRREGIDA